MDSRNMQLKSFDFTNTMLETIQMNGRCINIHGDMHKTIREVFWHRFTVSSCRLTRYAKKTSMQLGSTQQIYVIGRLIKTIIIPYILLSDYIAFFKGYI